MRALTLIFFFIITIFPRTGVSVPFVKYKTCTDAFNCEQEKQNAKKFEMFITTVQEQELLNKKYKIDKSPVCSSGRQADSEIQTVTVYLEFMTLYDNALIISNGKMIFKHVSWGIPFIVSGHGGSSSWHFYPREPSNVGTDLQNNFQYKNKAYVSASNQTNNADEKNVWKFPAFIPYSLGLNYNPNCTMILKNLNVLAGNVTVGILPAVNRGNSMDWKISVLKYPAKGDEVPSEYVKLQFDLEYFGYEEIEEDTIEE